VILNPINWILFIEELVNFADESLTYWGKGGK
jgi:hypothetical protein